MDGRNFQSDSNYITCCLCVIEIPQEESLLRGKKYYCKDCLTCCGCDNLLSHMHYIMVYGYIYCYKCCEEKYGTLECEICHESTKPSKMRPWGARNICEKCYIDKCMCLLSHEIKCN